MADMEFLKGFDVFTDAGKSFKPKISIRKTGQVGFNNGAIKRFALSDFEYVVLMYNKETEKIALKFTNDMNEDGAIKFTKKKGNYFVSGKSFMEKYSISYTESKSFDVEWIDEHNIAIIDIKDEFSKI